MNEKRLSIHDKLFLVYNLVMKIEKEELSNSQFNDLSINGFTHHTYNFNAKEYYNFTNCQIDGSI